MDRVHTHEYYFTFDPVYLYHIVCVYNLLLLSHLGHNVVIIIDASFFS